MHTGPLGSTVHVLRADSGTVTDLAAVDWSRRFRRVRLDPVRGIIALMSPSHSHEELSTILDTIVDVAASTLVGAAKALRSTRLRRPEAPRGTGLEPDCAFYVGERARAFRAALVAGTAAAEAFIERTAPDLVVEVEVTHADEDKIERCAELGVRELWRLHGRADSRELRVDVLALRANAAPRELTASEVVPGITPGDVCEAVDGVRAGVTHDERTHAVARIVRRRQRHGVRVREGGADYLARSAVP